MFLRTRAEADASKATENASRSERVGATAQAFRLDFGDRPIAAITVEEMTTGYALSKVRQRAAPITVQTLAYCQLRGEAPNARLQSGVAHGKAQAN